MDTLQRLSCTGRTPHLDVCVQVYMYLNANYFVYMLGVSAGHHLWDANVGKAN